MCKVETINTVESFIKITRQDYEGWGLGGRPWFPWFRGEPEVDTPLLPQLFRSHYKQLADDDFYENRLLQHFLTMALAYGDTPRREETDRWLFLARHVGLPTRLLDWTGNSLAALYFALRAQNPVVWMLNPFCLNNMAMNKTNPEKLKRQDYNIYGLTWFKVPPPFRNIANENIRLAWGEKIGTELPAAIAPTYVHQRIAAQKGYFTVHGKKEESLCKLLVGRDEHVLRKYIIDPASDKQAMLDQLQVLGVSEVTLFPELDGLAKGLTELFRPDLASWISRPESACDQGPKAENSGSTND